MILHIPLLAARPTGYARHPLVAVCAALCLAAAAPSSSAAQDTRLVVAVSVDQLRGDLIERYSAAFTGGIRRFLDEGYRFTQASHAHARTSTAPGHATITTGVFPSRHGVVANNWRQRRGTQFERMYAVEDTASPILGFENEPLLTGRSPRTLLREGLPDWFVAFDEDSRRISISRKDRAAIPMGGKGTEHVYWILPELGRFITSTHYMDRYPGWLQDFNEEVMPGIMGPPVWATQVPEAHRGLARADSTVFEGDMVHTAFPHVSAEENVDTSMAQHYVWGSDRPFADNAVMALAETALDELDLGQGNRLDYMALSLSASDRVGHRYGPNSQEVLSTLVNVDRLLGDFFALLDEEVGEGRWVVGLTADHGVVDFPEAAQTMGNDEAERVMLADVTRELSALLSEASQAGGRPEEIAERVARSVEAAGLASRAYTHHDLTRGEPADSFAILYRNSYYPGRAWDILSRYGVDLRFGEGDYVGSRTGTNHETPYWYDRWVPMMFLGPGVLPGKSDDPVYTVDFAPTLAAFVGVPVPDDLDGRRIY